jgi:CheY-like chemotaxis protein
MIAARHELTVDLPRDPIELDADPARLAQVFGNLLNNAAKYSPPQSRIVVSAAHEGDEAVIRVRDSGFGIPAEMLPRIFEMFVQVDHGLERSHGGLGIGLTLVRRFVEMHGGTVTAKSAGHNRGSEFTVRLPLPKASDAAVTMPMPANEEQETAVVHRILIVEDNIDGAESLRQLLQSVGHEVRWTDNGIDAIDLVTAFKPDVVLMDLGLPRLNGFEAARRIRQLDAGKNIALIALTGWGQAEHRRRSREVGFDVHFVKPLDFTRLQDTLRALEQRGIGNAPTPAAGNHA